MNGALRRCGTLTDGRLSDVVVESSCATLMSLHRFPDHRHRFKRHLLDYYHAALIAHGVPDYARRALDDHNRLTVLWQAATPVWQAANDIPSWIRRTHLERILWRSTILAVANCSPANPGA